ncbi:hypothetical protein GCM10023093_10030 [Nemorincola caseinilytica]|uniref:Uncharacterized protein n=1 Tax=Nemorincola caseinilytica TaxID=2054315 RepID=A0ABP8NAN1_9BACT
MFRKTLFILFVLPVMGAAIMMSCGKADGYICNMNTRFDIERDSVSPRTKPMTIVLEAYQKLTSNCSAPIVNPFLSTSYAMQPACIKWLNDIKWSTLTISFDRPLPMGGDTLHAGANFIDHPLINGRNKFKKETDCHAVTYRQVLSADIVRKIAFDTGIYQMSVHCETSDNRIIDQVSAIVFER